jgi:thiol-disulfide isomerase/thioredoxin
MELSDAQFKESVYDYDVGEIRASRPVMAELFTDWCAACKSLAPTLDKMAQKFEGRVDIIKVNITKSDALTSAMDIQGVPTLLFFRPETKSRQTMVGATSSALVEKAITDYLL